jgi:hypothetical protein
MKTLTLSLLFAASASLSACADDAPAESAPSAGVAFEGSASSGVAFGELTARPAVVVRQIRVAGSVSSSIAPGFDLDGRVSNATDREACGKKDFTSPEGTTGIDNQLGAVWASVYDLAGVPVEGLIKAAVNDGKLAFVVEFDGLDDPWNDDDVTLRLFRGYNEKPIMGTTGVMQAGQTFEVRPDAPVVVAENAQIVDGRLRLSTEEYHLDLELLAEAFAINVVDMTFELQFQEDGTWEGYLGCGVSVEEISDIARTYAESESRIIVPLLPNIADLRPGPDNKCTYVSAVLELKGIDAFIAR